MGKNLYEETNDLIIRANKCLSRHSATSEITDEEKKYKLLLRSHYSEYKKILPADLKHRLLSVKNKFDTLNNKRKKVKNNWKIIAENITKEQQNFVNNFKKSEEDKLIAEIQAKQRSLEIKEQELEDAIKKYPNRLFSDRQRSEVYLRDKGICQICGTFVTIRNYDCDHIVPYSRGGKTELSNAQCLCFSCNRIKGNKII
jgi:rubrerythrin